MAEMNAAAWFLAGVFSGLVVNSLITAWFYTQLHRDASRHEVHRTSARGRAMTRNDAGLHLIRSSMMRGPHRES